MDIVQFIELLVIMLKPSASYVHLDGVALWNPVLQKEMHIKFERGRFYLRIDSPRLIWHSSEWVYVNPKLFEFIINEFIIGKFEFIDWINLHPSYSYNLSSV